MLHSSQRDYENIAWVILCITLVSTCLMTNAIPFLGIIGIIGSSGKAALSAGVLCIGTALTATFWLVAVRCHQAYVSVSPKHFGLVILAGLIILSTIFAPHKQLAIFGAPRQEQGLIVWLVVLAFCWLISQLACTTSRLQRLFDLIVGMGTVVSVLGVLEAYGVEVFPWNGPIWYAEQGSSLFQNPDPTAAFLVAPLLLALIGFSAESNQKRQTFLAVCASLIGAELIITTNRGGLIAATTGLMGLLVFFLWQKVPQKNVQPDKKLRKRVLALISLSVAILIVLGSPAAKGWSTKLSQPQLRTSSEYSAIFQAGEIRPTDHLLGGRVGAWRELIPAVADRPLLGWGAGSIEIAWQHYAGDYSASVMGNQASLDDSHSQYLNMALSFGIPFLAVYATLLILLLTTNAKSVQPSTPPLDAWMRIGLVCAVIGISTVFSTTIATLPHWVLLFCLIGLLLRQAPASLQPNKSHASSRGLRPRTLVPAIALTTAICVFGTLMIASALVANYMPYESPESAAVKTLTASRITPWRLAPAREMMGYFILFKYDIDQLDMSQDNKNRLRNYLVNACPEIASYGTIVGEWLYYSEPSWRAKSELMIDNALHTNPDLMRALCVKSLIQKDNGDYDEAIQTANKAIYLEARLPVRLQREYPWQVKSDTLLAAKRFNSLEKFLVDYKRRFPKSMKLAQVVEAMQTESP